MFRFVAALRAERANGQERRAFGVSELEWTRRLAIRGHAHGINRGDGPGKLMVVTRFVATGTVTTTRSSRVTR
jgi:hypothetical protein